MSDARYWKQLLSQHRKLPLQHNHALQLVRTVILHNHHNAGTKSSSQHPKSNASVAMALTIYTFALKAGHRQQDCIGINCRQCNLKHHTLLHLQSCRPTRSVNNTVEDNHPNLAAEETSVATTPSLQENQIIATSISQQKIGNISLQTALIPVLPNGETYYRALLDSRS